MIHHNILHKFESLSSNKKLAVCLAVAENVFDKIREDNCNTAAIESLNISWKWLCEEAVASDDIYGCLENEGETGLAVYEYETKEGSQLEAELSGLILAVSFGAWLAYKKEHQIYMPPAIEDVDEDTANKCLEMLSKAKGYSDNLLSEILSMIAANGVSEIDRTSLLN